MTDKTSELQSQVNFLENLVFRLSQEVSKIQESDSSLREETKKVLSDLPEDLDVPDWLTSVDVLSPLLRAFESYTNELKGNIEFGKRKCQDLEEQAKKIVAENQSLRDEVVELTEKVVRRVQQQSIQSKSYPENIDSRLQLLEKENDLLRTQNGKLNQEISTLHSSLEEKKEHLLSLQDQKEASFDSLHTLQRENNSLKAKLIDSESQIQVLNERNDVLEKERGTSKGHPDAGVISAASGIKVSQERVDKTKAHLSDLKEENASLLEELSNQKSISQSAVVEAAELRKQVVSLTDLASKLEIRNSELQTKDLDSINLIQSLSQNLKEEKAMNSIHTKGKMELEEENKVLLDKMKGQAKGLRASLKELYHTRVTVAESSSRQMEELVSSLKNEIGHVKALYERAQRDSEFYKCQVSEMKNLNEGYPSEVEELLRRIEKVEEERDAAKHDSLSSSGIMKRVNLDHERLVNSLSMEKERAYKVAQLSKDECRKLQGELSGMQASVKESDMAREEAQKSENDLKDNLTQKLAMLKTESEEQIKFLEKRLEEELELKRETVTSQFENRESNASVSASRAEAEEAKIKYESMERELRAESINFSRRLDAVNEENSKLREENTRAIKHLNILTQQNREAFTCITDAENEMVALKERLKAAVSKEAQLIQEKEEVYSDLEGVKLEMAKAVRAQSNSQKRVDFLRNQCETLQEALTSSHIVSSRGVIT